MQDSFALPREGAFSKPYSSPHIVQTASNLPGVSDCKLFLHSTLKTDGVCSGSPSSGNFKMITGDREIITCDKTSCTRIAL